MHWIIVVGFAMMWLPLIVLLLGRALGGLEDETAQGGIKSGNEDSLERDSFFIKPHDQRRSVPSGTVEDRTVIRLEDYLRAEHEEAQRFVSRPSIGSLYRNCGQGL